MNWPDDVVERVAYSVGLAVSRVWKKTKHSPRFRTEVAQAATSAITLQDIAKLPEVKALVEAGNRVFQCDDFRRLPQSIQLALAEALAPFTEVSNG